MKNLNIIGAIALVLLIWGCNKNDQNVDAYGNFQAVEVIVSAQTSGQILSYNSDEGDVLKVEQEIVLIDTTQYYLKVQEFKARKKAVLSKKQNIAAQVAVLEKQKDVLQKDLNRINNMFKDGAATQKQVDDLNGQMEIIGRQALSVKSNLEAIDAEAVSVLAGIRQAEDMLRRCRVSSPVSGTILEKYCEKGELVAPGKPLFKIANLDIMELKAYISGEQLSGIKIGQVVTVAIDKDEDSNISYNGKITWIASEAEFTPKNIQTKEERVSQVYAIKVKVKNDGAIKINMPGEVLFQINEVKK